MRELSHKRVERASGLPETEPSLRSRLGTLRAILVVAILCGVASALGVAHVTLHLRELDVGHALANAAAEQAKLAERRRRLRIEVAALKSPERVIPAARKLRLHPPEPTQIRRERR